MGCKVSAHLSMLIVIQVGTIICSFWNDRMVIMVAYAACEFWFVFYFFVSQPSLELLNRGCFSHAKPAKNKEAWFVFQIHFQVYNPCFFVKTNNGKTLNPKNPISTVCWTRNLHLHKKKHHKCTRHKYKWLFKLAFTGRFFDTTYSSSLCLC